MIVMPMAADRVDLAAAIQCFPMPHHFREQPNCRLMIAVLSLALTGSGISPAAAAVNGRACKALQGEVLVFRYRGT